MFKAVHISPLTVIIACLSIRKDHDIEAELCMVKILLTVMK